MSEETLAPAESECLLSPDGKHEFLGNFRCWPGGGVEGAFTARCRWCRLTFREYAKESLNG